MALDALDSRRAALEGEREERREAVQAARARCAGRAAREPRSAGPHRIAPLERKLDGRRPEAHGRPTRADQARGAELEAALADGDCRSSSSKASSRISSRAASRSKPNSRTERRALEEADGSLRALDEKRLDAETRVNAAREAMEQARMAAQESRVRREGIVEQFAATRFDLAEILAGLAADAVVAGLGRIARTPRAPISRSSAR